MPSLHIKRVYQPPADDDGLRILVDRLWPRGLSRQAARIDHWMKELSPSDALRHEFHARPERWSEFLEAYASELQGNAAVKALRALARKQSVTLLYAARDTTHNNAVALAQLLGLRVE
jgi:uncharacterized protein YeaO (DUF488 family)